MASIPLVATTIKPPESALSNLSDLLHAKAQMQGNQLQQQQIQGAQQENQLRALQIQDQQVLRTSAKGLDWAKPDTFDKWIANAQQNGVSPQTLSQLSLQRAQYKEQLAKTDKATLDSEQERNNQLLGHIDAIKAEKDPAKRAAIAQSQASQILSNGLVRDPQTTQMVQAIAQGQHIPTDDELQSFENGLVDHKTQVSQALEAQKANAADWKEFQGMGMLVNTRTGEVKTPVGQAMTPGMLESKFVAIQQKQNMKQPLQPEEAAFLKSYKQMKEIVPAYNFNLNNAPTGGGNGGPLSDTVIDALAAPGAKLKLADVLPMRAPVSVRQAAVNQILAKYPNYSTADYDIEKGVMKSATSGKIADNLTAFNTAIEHAKQLDAATDALGNINEHSINKIGNLFGVELGSDKVTNFNVIKSALSGEISKVFKGGQATDAEIKEVQGPFEAANSPAQLKGAIKAAISLMNSKRDALKQQVEKGSKGQANFGDDKPVEVKPTHRFNPASGKIEAIP